MHAFRSPMLGRARCDWSGLAVAVAEAEAEAAVDVDVERVFFGLATSTPGGKGQLGWPDPSLWRSRTSLKKAHPPHTGSLGCGGSERIVGFVGTGGHWRICADGAVVSFLVAEAIAVAGSAAGGSRSVLESIAESAGEEISHPCHLRSSSRNATCCTRSWSWMRLWR